MKKLIVLSSVVVVVFGLAGCAGLPSISVGPVSTAEVSKSDEPVVVDFKSDEVLCAQSGETMIDSIYYIAKVMTPASDKTKNQAEVLYVNDGTKAWTKWPVPSRKSEKADFVVGAVLFYPAGWATYESMTAADYRGVGWHLGRVTSTDDLFKNMVEVSGELYSVKFLRTPMIKVEE